MLIKKQVEETVEVKLPFFSKSPSQSLYYAIHENVSFRVLLGDFVCNVSIINDSSAISEAIIYEPITEMDFDFAYQMALERLTKAVHPKKEAV